MTPRIVALFVVAAGLLGCAWLPGGEAIASLLPTADFPVAATLEYTDFGTIDTGAFTMQATIVGTVLDQYGAAMADVTICFGPNEAEAVAIAVTDSAGAFSGTPPPSFGGTEGNLMWAYLPLYRFEPNMAQVGMLLGENRLDFTAYPSVYPVPAERDCR
jgi:hypothetical protein